MVSKKQSLSKSVNEVEKEPFVINNNIPEETRIIPDIESTSTNIKSTLVIMFKLGLFRNFDFVLFCVSNVMLFMALNIPFSYGPDMMVQRKIVSQDSITLSKLLDIYVAFF